MLRGVVISDTHWVHNQPLHWSYLLVKEFIKYFQPEEIYHLGDIGDFSYLSTYTIGRPLLTENLRFEEDLKLIRKELDWFSNYSENQILLEGNHDERLRRYIEMHPELEGLVNFPEDGFAYYPQLQQPIRVGKLNLCHGWWYGAQPAKKHLECILDNVIFGHTHRRSFYTTVKWSNHEPIEAHGIGCLSELSPAYLKGKPSGWEYEFAILERYPETGDFRVFRMPIKDGKIHYQGKTWSREDL